MTRDNIEARCRRISVNYSASNVCRFVRGGGTLCFIDTSPEQNGTRGIAFQRDAMTVFFGSGEPFEIVFSDIKSMQIISSFEDFYADELAVYGDDFEIRISDYSLDKSELKRFIEELSAESRIAGMHRAQAEEYARIIAQRLSENAFHEECSPEMRSGELSVEKADDEAAQDNTGLPNEPYVPEDIDDYIPEEKTVSVPENYKPAPIPEEKINWISGSFYARRQEIPEDTPVITAAEPVLETVPAGSETASVDRPEEEAPISEPIVLYSREKEDEAVPKHKEPFESTTRNEDRERAYDDPVPDGDKMAQLQNMSREETLSFLAESLSEINGADHSGSADSETPDITEEREEPFDIGADLKTISEISAPPEDDRGEGKLTVEPIWGDIYIKASRNLRELIESGRLSMEQIRMELKDKLISSARAFAEITADEARVPKVLVPRITELRSAANDFEQYFKSGEDIAMRAMFFMLYQMLSYADRIAETPETKERLNDFFRRFGPAGIALSMLDMRV